MPIDMLPNVKQSHLRMKITKHVLKVLLVDLILTS